jgi:uncharacterized membrane protein
MDWRYFLAQLCLWLGTLALAASVIFFFAFNWDDLGRFAKFGLVEAAIGVGLIALLFLDLDKAPGKAVLTLLCLLVGALLALTGQVYQTGADSYLLFGWWAALITPWVILGRFTPLWLLWLALINLTVYLYFAVSFDGSGLLWTLFAVNGLALVAWEAGHRLDLSWLRDHWPPRLAAFGCGFMATALGLLAVMDNREAAGLIAWLAWLGATYHWYRNVRFDLFMLAGGVLSLIIVATAFLSESLLETGSGALLIIGLAVIGMAGGGAVWLRSLSRTQAA